jgi:hypothetical protein
VGELKEGGIKAGALYGLSGQWGIEGDKENPMG